MPEAQVCRIDRERPVFLYPANASAYKNHQTFLRACEVLQEQGYGNYKVIWTVTGEENTTIRAIRKEAEERKLPIVFSGPMSGAELFRLYAFSILVFPSYIETIGLPLLEARAAGTWILAADCLYARDGVGDYEKAEFFEPFDANKLSDCMKRWIS